MSETLLRLPGVIQRVGLSRSTIYRLVRAGSFPEPITIAGRLRAWPESEIDQWIDERIASSRAESGEP
jgi:prophage regulatory protein